MKQERHAEVKRIFLEAVELDGERRDQLLEQRCGEDDQLREEVESLLSHHSSETILPGTSSNITFASSNHNATTVRVGRRPEGVGSPRRSRPVRLGPRGQLAVGALIAGALLLVFGLWQRARVTSIARETFEEELTSLLDAEAATLVHWGSMQKATVESWCRDPELRSRVQQLVEMAAIGLNPWEQLRQAAQHELVRNDLQVFAGSRVGYIVWDRRSMAIAESSPEGGRIGKRVSAYAASSLVKVFGGQTVLLMCGEGKEMVEDEAHMAEKPHFHVTAPLRDEQGNVFAALTIFNIGLAENLNNVLRISRDAKTSESYVFDASGVMLSESRFSRELKAAGLIPDEGDNHTSMRVVLRDPGGDLTAGYRPSTSLSACPLTKMARHAIAGKDGFDLDGYRNYLGRKVVGAWRWQPKNQVGIATEASYDEMYAGLRLVGRYFIFSFALLAASVAGILISFYWISRLRRQVGLATQLGQYTLEELLGEGGMGRVYRARHALLKRPVAVKLLKPDQVSRRTLAWFDREVQLASQLNHPNTIAVHDYGTTPEGIFYYVMELLPGLTLEELVELEGAIPWERAVYILRQVCASLCEAHQMGLVHRDIKPRNIMLCERGGEADIVKVLDFGLVKNVGNPDTRNLSASLVVAGTPLYMAPERWQDPTGADARSDIYSLGGVAFKLLTGQDVFVGSSEMDLLQHVINSVPERPSQRTSGEIPPDIDQLVVDCLAKNVEQRPETIAEVDRILENVTAPDRWNQTTAKAWWKANADRVSRLRKRATIEHFPPVV